MIGTIKPIETHYNGYRFRSRLEARHARFLDALGIRYQYEPEGFRLDDLWYLPDFYLPSYDTWIEIKPTMPSYTGEAMEKAKRLFLATSSRVYIFHGDVWPAFIGESKALGFEWTKDAEAKVAWGRLRIKSTRRLSTASYRWARCPRCGYLGIWRDSDNKCPNGFCQVFIDRNILLLQAWDSEMMKAYQCARQARFEHGERGR